MYDLINEGPINTWHESEQPREKLSTKGVNALSDSELLAIILGSGFKSKSVVAVARHMLNFNQNKLHVLANQSLTDLKKFKGIGTAKAVAILAAFELGRRRELEAAQEQKTFKTSNEMYQYLKPLIGYLEHEEFWVVYLNNSNKILSSVKISSGGLTCTVVDIRVIFKQALQLSAVAIILAHNHPSGNVNPSKQDFEITQKIALAGKQLDIAVLDHIIVSSNNYYSFKREEEMPDI
ncbi:DNA repair protein RadC [Flavobacterium sp.]|uniref:RadC family protein n=1 Tax=Flavobacterium sp. TaxID=239 RepID=UPI00262F7B32|nr:DNA repair protein RadC [Flavobacterium sp.]